MKRKHVFPSLCIALFFAFTIPGCQKESDPDLEQPIVIAPQEEVDAAPKGSDDYLPPIDWEGDDWIEYTEGVYITPEFYRSGLSDPSGRFTGNCPTCTFSYCNTCASGWDCTNRDCLSSSDGAGTAQWYSGGTILESKSPFIHQRYAECLPALGCLYDKDNRFYFTYSPTMNDPSKLRIQYSGSKSWFCSSGPAVDYLTSAYGQRYIRVTTGQYCPTSNIRLVRIP